MVNLWKSLISILLIFILMDSVSLADEQHATEYKGTQEFERIKSIVGVWQGTSIMGKGGEKQEENVTVEYKLTSGGSALVETLFPGTPHEMVSVYHDKGGKLSMTHYCMLGNQPQMNLKKSEGNVFEFDLISDGDINAQRDQHMHSLTISFLDNNNIIQKWTLYEDGKEKDTTTIKLTRVN